MEILVKEANPDELFDVVDVNDQVVAQAPRREVHAKKLWHRAVHVLIHDNAGNLFLQRRSPGKDTFPNCWDSSCSGHVDAGENYMTAARRELGEELGWHDQTLPLRPLLKLPAGPETGHEFIEISILGPLSGPFDLHPGEITEGRWITPGELDLLIEKSPEQIAGALRHLWLHHRVEIISAISVPRSN
ncbi:MAG TPA: NUDIX domain-containing protein [Candidatus Methylacidiphilales bacterium]